MQPRILSLGFAVPGYSCSQEEALGYLGYTSPGIRKIFKNTGIQRRYSWIEPKRFLLQPSWQELCTEYAKGVVEVGVAAAKDALGEISVDRIGLITFVSVTGYSCPSPSYAIAGALGLRADVSHSNLLGQGCEAALPGLERAYDYVLRTRKLALCVSVELPSCTYFPSTDPRDLEYVISASLFGDGASAAVIGLQDTNPEFPEILDFESYFSPQYIDLLGYKWEEGRMKVILDKRVPEIVPPLMREVAEKVLSRNGLSKEDIRFWIIHPGGKSVLENIERELGLSREQTHYSWKIMSEYGNMSSATIGAIAKALQEERRPKDGRGMVLTQGAGTAVNACLIRWGNAG